MHRRALRIAAALLLAALLLLLLRSAWPPATDTAPTAPAPSGAAALAPTDSGAADAAEVEPRETARADAATEATEAKDSQRYHDVRVRVVDDRDQPIAGARVQLGPFEPWRTVQDGNTDTDGRILLRIVRYLGPREGLGVVASIPGRSVERSLAGLDPDAEVVLTFADVGYLQLDVRGPFLGVHAQATATQDGEDRGSTGSIRFASPSQRLAVALGAEFRIVAWSGAERQTRQGVTGPTYPQQVVPIEFDFRRCTVRFRLPGANADLLAAMLLTETRCVPTQIKDDDGGGFVTALPLCDRGWLVVTYRDRCYESPPMVFADAIDLGAIALTERPVHGTVALQRPDGSFAPQPQAPAAYEFQSGRMLAASMQTRALSTASSDGRATCIRGLHLFRSVLVQPQVAGFYASPSAVTLTRDTAVDVQLRAAAKVRLEALDPGPLRTLWLMLDGAERRARPRRSYLGADKLPVYEFEDLEPGDYRIEVADATVAPDRIQVTGGSEQTLRVTISAR